MSVASLAGYLQGGGGNVQLVEGDGINIVGNGSGEYTISNTGALSIEPGDGIAVAEVDGVYTITNTGVGAVITLEQGDGISIVQDPPNTYTITNTGGGGGGAVNGLVAGDGIGVEDNGQGVFTISNGGVINIVEGAGIEVTGVDQVLTVKNLGVLNLTAGDGISITGTKDNLTITNDGGGQGGISAVDGGAGITADTNTDTGVVSLTNTGVLALTAGTGITITGGNDNRTINATGTNTFADVVITSGGYTATLATNAASNLTVNTEIVATEPWVAGAYQPVGNYITSETANKMFIFTYTETVTIQPGGNHQFIIQPTPTIGYNVAKPYECIALPIYSLNSLPCTIGICGWANSGSTNHGTIQLVLYNNNTSESIIHSIICYGFQTI